LLFGLKIILNKKVASKRKTCKAFDFKMKIFSFLFLAAVIFIPSLAFAGKQSDLKTYLEISIEMEKKDYKLGELLEGNVIIKNTAPAFIPGSFEVKLTKGEEERFSTNVYVKDIPVGETKFRFKNFGVPLIRDDETSVGDDWRLVVHERNREYEKAEAEFSVGEKEIQ